MKSTKQRPKMYDYVDALHQSLPASSYDEIRLGMTKELGRRIGFGTVNNCLHYVRTHVNEVGFTVPYVKRGCVADGDEGRFFVMPLEKDGTFTIDDEHRRHFDNGCYVSVADIDTTSKNLVQMISTRIKYERSPVTKDALADMQENMEFVAKRAARLKAKIAA